MPGDPRRIAVGPEIWDDSCDGLILKPGGRGPKISITDKGEDCRTEDCDCICFHVHDEIAGMLVMKANKACKAKHE